MIAPNILLDFILASRVPYTSTMISIKTSKKDKLQEAADSWRWGPHVEDRT